MGSAFSSNPPPTDVDILPVEEPKRIPYNGIPVPDEASTSLEDSRDWYADFFEKAFCAPHKGGKNVIICWPREPRGHMRDYRELEGWPVIKIQKAYEKFGEDHPRIVRYIGKLEDGSVVVEKLSPGPLDFKLPAMAVPVPEMPSRNDKIMLSLYYRWALQSLSALDFILSHSVFLRTSPKSLVWLRSDYSLALTGFVSSEVVGDETDYMEGGWVGDEEPPYGDLLHGSFQEEIFYWATFVWGLMTNCYTDQSPSIGMRCWEPVCPVEGCDPSDYYRSEYLSDRWARNLFQGLEEARLGSVLLKAWNGKYESVDEVAKEIRLIAARIGIRVDGDEVKLDKKWEDIFEVVQMGSLSRDRRLEFKSSK